MKFKIFIPAIAALALLMPAGQTDAEAGRVLRSYRQLNRSVNRFQRIARRHVRAHDRYAHHDRFRGYSHQPNHYYHPHTGFYYSATRPPIYVNQCR